MGVEESLAAKFTALFPHLDERQRPLTMGAEARVLGHGGIAVVGVTELQAWSASGPVASLSVASGPISASGGVVSVDGPTRVDLTVRNTGLTPLEPLPLSGFGGAVDGVALRGRSWVPT